MRDSIGSMGALDIKVLNAALVATRFAARVQHFATIGSTSSALLAAANDAPTHTVYIADEQTAGRGRGAHAWHSAAGDGLYVSVLVRPELPLRRALWLSLATGLAVQAAVRATTGLEADIRWPNDILLGTGRAAKKLGGILVESAIESSQLRHAVIGIGLNVNHADFPAPLAALATSLRLATGNEVDRTQLVIAMLRALDLELAGLEARDETLLARFAAASTWARGKHVTVDEAGGYTGVTTGLNAEGFLTVRTPDGTTRTVLSGGVRELF